MFSMAKNIMKSLTSKTEEIDLNQELDSDNSVAESDLESRASTTMNGKSNISSISEGNNEILNSNSHSSEQRNLRQKRGLFYHDQRTRNVFWKLRRNFESHNFYR